MLLLKTNSLIKQIFKSIYRKLSALSNVILKTFVQLHPDFRSFVTVSNIGRGGRLGNQLFQYFFARSLSINSGCKVELDISDFSSNKYSYLKKLELYKINSLLYRDEDIDLFIIHFINIM